MKRCVPKYVKEKINRANKLMKQIVNINIEVEQWMEGNGIENGYDFTGDYRDDRGYGYVWVQQLIDSIEEAIN